MISIEGRKRHVAGRIHELTDALIDECISACELRELQTMLTNSVEARQTYVEAMLLHAHLHYLGKRSTQER